VAFEWRSYKMPVDPGGLWRIQTSAETEARDARISGQPCTFRPSGAAQESNLPTVGLPRPAGFEVETALNLGARFGGVSGILSGTRTNGYAQTRTVDHHGVTEAQRTDRSELATW